ncbi:glycosyltransferase family 2 protein [Teredinibacter haidensis]|uniref:glycosyltransferase family 2 protein n=1 Tax=Teredinibacter haidensis TaxID=2731755 RepID=UPI0009490B20|nr:glycosyltransferase family A protein [Teredinibacter haidensis]
MNKTLASISLVIPLYNKANHILHTLESVLNQSEPVLEIIIVNDGSTDRGEKIVQAAIENQPQHSQVRLINQKNGGVSRARNTGIAAARGTHVAFMDADDYWLPGATAEFYKLIQMFPHARAQATNYIKVEGEHTIQPKIRFAQQMEGPCLLDHYFSICARGDLPFFSSSICAEKSLLQEVGGFPVGEAMGEDQDVWSKIALQTDIAYSPKQLAAYVLDSDNRACKRLTTTEECPFSKRLHRAVQQGDIPQPLSAPVLTYTATHLLYLAADLIRSGELEPARTLLNDSRCALLPLKRSRLLLHMRVKQLTQWLPPSLQPHC